MQNSRNISKHCSGLVANVMFVKCNQTHFLKPFKHQPHKMVKHTHTVCLFYFFEDFTLGIDPFYCENKHRFYSLQFPDSVFQTYFPNTVQLLHHFLYFFMLVIFPPDTCHGEDVGPLWHLGWGSLWKQLTARNHYCAQQALYWV